jgi:hypothetical protein
MTPAMVSGRGKYHGKNVGSYDEITYQQIQALVDSPQQIDKDSAQWVIPSTRKTRDYAEQRAFGDFWMLWADIDKNPPPVEKIVSILRSLGCDCEIYSSRSATDQVPKCRILIPLAYGLSGADWRICQKLFNDLLEAFGITPDRSSERAAQPCYLPNKEHFYFSRSRRDGIAFDVISVWANEIEREREAVAAEMAQQQAEKEAREAARATKQVDPSKSLIHAFNEMFDIGELLHEAGYDEKDGKFRHPASQSGSFSANIKDGRVYTFSSADPLYCEDGAHDAFSVFTVLFADGDLNKALRMAGDDWVKIGDESWNSVRRRERTLAEFEPITDDTQAPSGELNSEDEGPFCLSKFALNGRSDAMRERMLSDVYVIGKIAILGQTTVIYAPPNAGKTLITIALLIETIKNQTLPPENILYINADDNAKGLLQKLVLAEKHGFLMLAPGEMGYRLSQTQSYLLKMVKDNTAHGKVVVLDTAKKFTDIMDKKSSSDFGKVIRSFVMAGGSVIMLAHVNKHRDAEGHVIAAGTSDLTDDADCAYTVDVQSEGEGRYMAIFENKKARGDVELSVAYRYSRLGGQDYESLVDSVELVSEQQLDVAKRAKEVGALLHANRELIETITEVIKAGYTNKTDLIKEAVSRSGLGRGAVRKVLAQHTGLNIVDGHRWHYEVGEKNIHVYKMLPFMGGSLPTPPQTSQTPQSASLDEFECQDLV